MKLSQETIKKIKSLRRTGRSIPEISRELFLPKSTVSRHIQKVKILPAYYSRWLARRNAAKIISERNWSAATQKAERLLASLSSRDLSIIGAMLYWGEGSKRDFGLSNTDSELVRVFIYTLKKAWGVSTEDIKISLRLYEDLDQGACLRYWSKITGVKLGNHTSINTLYGSKQGKLKYGMCRIRVKKGGWLLKEITSINKRVAELTQ